MNGSLDMNSKMDATKKSSFFGRIVLSVAAILGVVIGNAWASDAKDRWGNECDFDAKSATPRNSPSLPTAPASSLPRWLRPIMQLSGSAIVDMYSTSNMSRWTVAAPASTVFPGGEFSSNGTLKFDATVTRADSSASNGRGGWGLSVTYKQNKLVGGENALALQYGIGPMLSESWV